VLFGPRTPSHGDAQLRGNFAEVFERPAFVAITRKGMDDTEVLLGRQGNGDVWDPVGWRRKCRKERERKMAHSISKLRTMGPVPGIDGVECL
jgi:hypothetical protein